MSKKELNKVENVEAVDVVNEQVEEQATVQPKEQATTKRTRKKPTPPKEVKHSVTVYGKPNCKQCEFTKNYLDDMGTPYNYVDVTEDEEALKEIKDFGYMGVPVVAVNSLDDSWGGFRPDKLEELRGVK